MIRVEEVTRLDDRWALLPQSAPAAEFLSQFKDRLGMTKIHNDFVFTASGWQMPGIEQLAERNGIKITW
jgi:hypothetical protein